MKIHYPATRISNHCDQYFGVSVPDPYRWLEDDTNEEVKNWVNLQNETTENYFQQIPFRQAIRKRLAELMNFTQYSIPRQSGEWLIYFKTEGLKNQPVLFAQKGLKGLPIKLLDINEDRKKGTSSIGEFALSKNQKYFAYCLAEAGSDWQSIEIMDFQQSILLEEKIRDVKFSHICWQADEGFYYSGFDGSKMKLKISSPYHFTKGFLSSDWNRPKSGQACL